MGTLINFLIDNYIFIVFIAILLILALVGYIVDSSKNNGSKGEAKKVEDDIFGGIPLANIDANVKLGDNLNKMTLNNAQLGTPTEPVSNNPTPQIPVENVNAEATRSPLDLGK